MYKFKFKQLLRLTPNVEIIIEDEISEIEEIKETGSPSNISCQILVCQFDV